MKKEIYDVLIRIFYDHPELVPEEVIKNEETAKYSFGMVCVAESVEEAAKKMVAKWMDGGQTLVDFSYELEFRGKQEEGDMYSFEFTLGADDKYKRCLRVEVYKGLTF